MDLHDRRILITGGASAGFAGKILPPDAAAAEIVEGLGRDRFRIRVGRGNALARLGRLWPAAANRIIAHELGLIAVPSASRAES